MGDALGGERKNSVHEHGHGFVHGERTEVGPLKFTQLGVGIISFGLTNIPDNAIKRHLGDGGDVSGCHDSGAVGGDRRRGARG